jgi:hypothetical protein
MLTEAGTQNSILSQFPRKCGCQNSANSTTSSTIYGPNTKWSFIETVKGANFSDAHMFRVWVPNDHAFDQAVNAELSKSTWQPVPAVGASGSTDCSAASARVLRSGGYDIPLGAGTLPNAMFHWLEHAAGNETLVHFSIGQ